MSDVQGMIMTPQQIAMQQQLAQQMMQQGTSTTPIASPWQGAARLAQTLAASYMNNKAAQNQNLGTANADAEFSNALGSDPGQANIPSTPGRTSPALQQNDAVNDATADNMDNGASPNAALLAALAASRGQTPPQSTPQSAGGALAGGAPPSNSNPATAPRGIANNNPGNLESNAWTASLPGYVGSDGRFAIFNSLGAGAAALDQNLQSYGRQGISTPSAIASKWAPGSEAGNNPSSYGGAIASALGVGPNDKVNLADPGTRATIAQAIARVENGPGALAAINAATGASGAPPPSSPMPPAYTDLSNVPGAAPGLAAMAAPALAAISAQSSPAQGAGAPAPVGPQGAGVPSPAPAPSQAAPAPAPSAPGAQPGVAGGSPAMSPQGAPGGMSGFHPDIQALMQVMSDPWASPAQQQIAQQMISLQMPQPPTFGVIGKDVAGNEQYGWISPRTQTVTPANTGAGVGGAGGALPPVPGSPTATPPPGALAPAPSVAGSTANGLTPQGATYLDGMEAKGGASAVVARNARAIISGGAPLPEANAATRPIDVAIRDAVFRAAPGFNSSVAAAKNKAVIDFSDTSTPQSPGGLILNLNGALSHAGELSDASDALGADQFNNARGPNELLNMGVNYFGGKDHQEKLAAYNANANTFVDEAIKFYQGSGGTELDRKKMMDELSPDAAPDVRDAAIARYVSLLQDKAGSLQEKWKQAAPGADAFPVIGPQGAAAAQRVLSRNPLAAQSGAAAPYPSVASGVPKAGASPSMPTITDKAAYDALPPGTKYIAPDGMPRVKS